MSGPKTSRYTLSEAQIALIQKQMKERTERMLKEAKRISALNDLISKEKKLDIYAKRIDASLNEINKVQTDGQLGPIDISEYHSILSDVEKQKKHLLSLNRSIDIESIEQEEKKLNSFVEELVEADKKVNNLLAQTKNTYKEVVISKLSSLYDISFANIANRNSLKENPDVTKILEALDSVANYEKDAELTAKYDEIKKKANEITSTDFLDNYYSISVVPFVKACASYHKLREDIGDDYNDLLLRYKILSEECGTVYEEVPFGTNCISELLMKISDCEKTLLAKREDEYICSCIDQAMDELGYNVIGNREVTKKSGKHFRNELYKFAEGTVVNVTYADNGQITMELGATDTINREPTPWEEKVLVDRMTDFCGSYSILEEKLKEKGIEPKRIAVLPPSVEYAQVIDISGYEMHDSVGRIEHKRAESGRDSNQLTLD